MSSIEHDINTDAGFEAHLRAKVGAPDAPAAANHDAGTEKAAIRAAFEQDMRRTSVEAGLENADQREERAALVQLEREATASDRELSDQDAELAGLVAKAIDARTHGGNLPSSAQGARALLEAARGDARREYADLRARAAEQRAVVSELSADLAADEFVSDDEYIERIAAALEAAPDSRAEIVEVLEQEFSDPETLLVQADLYRAHTRLAEQQQTVAAARHEMNELREAAAEKAVADYLERSPAAEERHGARAVQVLDGLIQTGHVPPLEHSSPEEMWYAVSLSLAVAEEEAKAYAKARYQQAVLDEGDTSIDAGLTLNGAPISPRHVIQPKIDIDAIAAKLQKPQSIRALKDAIAGDSEIDRGYQQAQRQHDLLMKARRVQEAVR